MALLRNISWPSVALALLASSVGAAMAQSGPLVPLLDCATISNNQVVSEPSVYLTCSTVLERRPAVPEPRVTLPRVHVGNEFGDDQLLRVAPPKMLCVPSTKTIVP
jgi:hypothetical protein